MKRSQEKTKNVQDTNTTIYCRNTPEILREQPIMGWNCECVRNLSKEKTENAQDATTNVTIEYTRKMRMREIQRKQFNVRGN